jgi:hypothetical protein
LKTGCYAAFKTNMRNAYKIIFRKLNRLLGRSSCSWEDSIPGWTTKIQGKKKVAWIHVAQDRNQWQAHVNMALNLHIPQKV